EFRDHCTMGSFLSKLLSCSRVSKELRGAQRLLARTTSGYGNRGASSTREAGSYGSGRERKLRLMRKQKGFSLIELLIVIAIILIIAAIAVPNLLRSKMAANEASAVGTVRSINNAEVLYSNTYPATGYAAAIANLGGASPCTPSLATGCIIDPNVAAG